MIILKIIITIIVMPWGTLYCKSFSVRPRVTKLRKVVT